MSIWIVAILVFLLGVLLNALFAGYETGFVSADRIRIEHLAEAGETRAAMLLRHMRAPERMITTVLVGTNGALIMGTMALSSRIETAWIVSLIATPIFLIFSEIIPKTIFRYHPNRLSLRLLPVIRFFDILLAPIVLPAMWIAVGSRWALGGRTNVESQILNTEEEFRSLIDESAARGTIELEEQRMIHSVMDLSTTQAKEIMVPRIDVQAVPITATRDELVAVFETSGRTRVPVYRETIDDIVGIAIAYEVLVDATPADPSIERFVKDVIHVPDTKTAGELLQELRAARQHVAVVTDEYGGTDGIITIEDIVEEIFGEIHDEHDTEAMAIQQVGPNAYIAEARMPLQEFAHHIRVAIDGFDAETVGGWLMQVAQKIPIQGEKIRWDGLRITVLEGTQNQIFKVRVDILPEARENPAPNQ